MIVGAGALLPLGGCTREMVCLAVPPGPVTVSVKSYSIGELPVFAGTVAVLLTVAPVHGNDAADNPVAGVLVSVQVEARTTVAFSVTLPPASVSVAGLVAKPVIPGAAGCCTKLIRWVAAVVPLAPDATRLSVNVRSAEVVLAGTVSCVLNDPLHGPSTPPPRSGDVVKVQWVVLASVAETVNVPPACVTVLGVSA